MPFVDAAGHPLDRTPLVYRGGLLFQLAEGFAWVDPADGTRVAVAPHDLARPATDPGNGTDLATVPPFLWGLVASYGRQTLPAILHDRLVDGSDAAPADQRLALRETEDDIFRRALVDAGLTDARAATMWAAVRVQAYLRHAAPLGIALIVQLVLGALACTAGVALAVVAHPLWLLLVALPGAGALAWWPQRRLVATAAYLSALYAPLVVTAALASGIEYAVAWLLWLSAGGRGAAPRPGPTLRADDVPPPRGRATPPDAG